MRCPNRCPAAPASGSTRLVEQLTVAPVQQRKKLVLEYLRNVVAEVTRIDASEIRDEAGFFDLGMDSLMAVELRRRLEQAVGKELPSTLAMDYPRLFDVADYLLGDVLSLNAPAPSAPGGGPAGCGRDRSRTDEPIAIVAVACRFPGAPDPEAYWEVLSGGVDAIREIPDDRFDVDEYLRPGSSRCRARSTPASGGYLDSIDGFDPEFFGISPREAVWIDPQQRLMLEIAWEGLERAGYSPGVVARQPNRRVRRGGRQRVFASAVRQLGREPSRPISSPAMRSMSSRVGSRSRSGWKGRRWRWTPRAARRWWPSIRPARPCIPVTATWRWPVG